MGLPSPSPRDGPALLWEDCRKDAVRSTHQLAAELPQIRRGTERQRRGERGRRQLLSPQKRISALLGHGPSNAPPHRLAPGGASRSSALCISGPQGPRLVMESSEMGRTRGPRHGRVSWARTAGEFAQRFGFCFFKQSWLFGQFLEL